ncbi:beta-mannosidase [Stagnihabitans tardus]|uniref:beta-mannosidase n=1 Tax=Stagnihabitans tardus TaxID=2699202 RepID=A0AAE4Y9N3_9RHOB|nr:glycoside hydrolase family 2 protein [Stagnihabitans tardus]NBZ87864.1 glycoside hydrolase family 2 protein [Stagnihabitans tardus]
MLNLAGDWVLSHDGRDIPFALPGDGIDALHKAGVIPDPYFGRNEYGLRWISNSTWVARRSFTVPRTDLVLVASMLDTLVSVAVNGVTVLTSDNMFLSHRVDLSGALRVGENEITLTFGNVVEEAARRQAAQRYFVPFSANNTPIHNGNMLRKPSCDFGWDWNIALAPFGVYGDLYLEEAGPRIDHLVISQAHEPGKATVTVEARSEEEGAEVSFALCGVHARAVVRKGVARAVLPVENPALWWPAGQGAQPLHELVVKLGAHRLTRRIGLRQMELVTEKDAVGLGFKFRVNGRDVFAKGANWIPQDALSGRINAEDTRGLLQSAVDANMNMIRVWGGGRYEPTWFYDLCDELGLMVWQDFMFSCHIYPADDAFLSGVAEEVRQNALRLHHHACLAVWCGDNELIGALTWFPETRANRDQYLVGYDRLNRTIEQALKAAVPGAVWWPSSPSPGPMDFGDAWHDDSKGDMHFWSVWHEGRDFDHYRDVSPRFCSEFGFQSYPSMATIRKFADPKDWNIAAPVMESHQKNAGGNARIAETMFRYFRFPVDFENFVYVSQVQQGLAIKTAVTHWRSLRPHCMGTLIWQLNDTWPVCSWASLDHGGNWKLLHHMAKDFFAPVSVSAVPVVGGVELRAVNDTGAPVTLTVVAHAVRMDGQRRELARATIEVAGQAVPALHVAVEDGEMLAFTWEGAGEAGEDLFAPKPFKAYDLLPAKLAHSIKKAGQAFEITVEAQSLALFVSLEADQPGRFSDNAFTLFPGQPARITFTPDHLGPEPRFTLRDLHSATYGKDI